MIEIEKVKNIYVYSGQTDFRLGINGLCSLINLNFPSDILIGNIFVFCNSKKNAMKIIEFDNTGIWLYYKKLHTQKFVFPNTTGTYEITKEDLKTIIQGLDFIEKIDGKYGIEYSYI